VDLNDLWLPCYSSFQTNRSSHSDWLTKLVIALLDSSGVTDEVLVAVKPVCKVKVSVKCRCTGRILMQYGVTVSNACVFLVSKRSGRDAMKCENVRVENSA